MKKIFTTFIATFIALNILHAQSSKELFMPKEIKRHMKREHALTMVNLVKIIFKTGQIIK